MIGEKEVETKERNAEKYGGQERPDFNWRRVLI
jgi:hypothetical protein